MPAKFEGLLDQSHLQDIKLDTTSSWRPTLRPRWSIDIIRPEFISTLRPGTPKSPVRRTAWLDGLRGFAAFVVFIHHNQLWAHGMLGNAIYENAFGFEGRHYFSALPFVRLFFAGGHFAVAIFFVISGYVLSVKALGLIQKGQYGVAADALGSALFRRWLRLYIPVIAVTLVWISGLHWTGIWVAVGEIKNTWTEDIHNWYILFKNYSFVFLVGNESMYEFTRLYQPHSWSIPIEFRGSIIVYTAVSALSRCTRNARLWCETGLIFYFLYVVDGWYGALFMAGMLLCDLDLLALDDSLPSVFSYLDSFKELIFFHLFILGLYLGGVPSCDGPDYANLISKSPGWKWLSKLKPQAAFDGKWFYLFWAAFLIVASIPRLPWLKSFFECRVNQYLARISFALYLVHGPVMWMLGDRLYAATGLSNNLDMHKEHIPRWVEAFPLSKKGPMGLELAWWAPQVVILPVTLYAAEVVTKLFDEPSVKISNWLYKKALAPAPPSPKIG